MRVISTQPMKHLVACALLATGCAKQATEKPKEPPAKAVELASLIPAGATGVSRFVPAQFPMTTMLASLTNAKEVSCWNELQKKVASAYQIEIKARRTSVFILEGDVTRMAAENCIPAALAKLPAAIRVTNEGDLAVFDAGPLGKAYAAWRGRFIVAGDRQSVVEALAGSPDGRAWTQRLAALDGIIAIASSDALFGVLLGVESTGWDLAFTDVSQHPEPVRMTGRIIVHGATPADAATAAKRVPAGDFRFPVKLPDKLVAALRKLKVTVRDKDVELAFDAATFAGVAWEDMQELQQSLQGALPE